ncbi:hypothetical protein DIE28_14310 [Paracoccus thiocyanatus]|uniref:Uncharacterized protein n=2 Tax=Paracoccus thiocyanatus TaxID=34006 RepID=A0A3D8P8B6_9RHOB|nr:hypothetical protein DIE28_14310 [Paracoccus thiocyanatus]
MAWSAAAVAATAAVVGVPALLGWWRLVQVLSALLVLAAAALWIMSFAGVGLGFPSRARAGVVIFPVMALWPALTAVLASRFLRAQRAPAEQTIFKEEA